ncbi:NifU family protein [Candidatus Babeliales bacterium]|nr:NifU family protein [Candidatus Babeliales bacterium]MBP9843571.1 NifU family protein [Candidatus Babeliales bacterium]
MGVTYDNEQVFAQVVKELEQMQSYVQSHQGEIELVSIKEYNVVIRLKGACDTCPLSFYTITFGLEKRLQSAINPAIRIIVED